MQGTLADIAGDHFHRQHVTAPRVHVVGAGAVGTVLAAHLAKSGLEPQLIIRPKDVPGVESADSIVLERGDGEVPLSADKPCFTTEYDFQAQDVVIICVKYRDLDEVCARLRNTPVEDLTLVPCLNGVAAAGRLRRAFPDTDVANLTIMFNAQLLAPLRARITTKPEVLLQSENSQLLRLLESAGLEATQVRDESVIWGKLLINLANALGALTHTTFKTLLCDPVMKRAFVLVLDEATIVLTKAEIKADLPIALPYGLYRLMILHGGPLPWWFARLKNGLTDASFPSMVADMEAGKKTEVRELNGEIVALAESLGINAPINRLLVSQVEMMQERPEPQYLMPTQLLALLESA